MLPAAASAPAGTSVLVVFLHDTWNCSFCKQKINFSKGSYTLYGERRERECFLYSNWTAICTYAWHSWPQGEVHFRLRNVNFGQGWFMHQHQKLSRCTITWRLVMSLLRCKEWWASQASETHKASLTWTLVYPVETVHGQCESVWELLHNTDLWHPYTSLLVVPRWEMQHSSQLPASHVLEHCALQLWWKCTAMVLLIPSNTKSGILTYQPLILTPNLLSTAD